jgi:hypothetical protein
MIVERTPCSWVAAGGCWQPAAALCCRGSLLIIMCCIFAADCSFAPVCTTPCKYIDILIVAMTASNRVGAGHLAAMFKKSGLNLIDTSCIVAIE